MGSSRESVIGRDASRRPGSRQAAAASATQPPAPPAGRRQERYETPDDRLTVIRTLDLARRDELQGIIAGNGVRQSTEHEVHAPDELCLRYGGQRARQRRLEAHDHLAIVAREDVLQGIGDLRERRPSNRRNRAPPLTGSRLTCNTGLTIASTMRSTLSGCPWACASRRSRQEMRAAFRGPDGAGTLPGSAPPSSRNGS